MGFGHDRRPLLGRHTFGKEDLHDVHAVVEQTARLGTGIVRAVDRQELAGDRRLVGRQFGERRAGGVDGRSRERAGRFYGRVGLVQRE